MFCRNLYYLVIREKEYTVQAKLNIQHLHAHTHTIQFINIPTIMLFHHINNLEKRNLSCIRYGIVLFILF